MSRVLRLGSAWWGGATAYVLLVLFDLPRPLYLPLERRVVLSEAPPAALPMGWYGALAVSAVIAGAVWLLGRWVPIRPLVPHRERQVVFLRGLALAFEALLLAWFELGRGL